MMTHIIYTVTAALLILVPGCVSHRVLIDDTILRSVKYDAAYAVIGDTSLIDVANPLGHPIAFEDIDGWYDCSNRSLFIQGYVRIGAQDYIDSCLVYVGSLAEPSNVAGTYKVIGQVTTKGEGLITIETKIGKNDRLIIVPNAIPQINDDGNVDGYVLEYQSLSYRIGDIQCRE